MHVVVAGGGLAGLVAASRLAEAGAEVELFEANDRVGGRVQSRTVEGFTLDRGFQVLFTDYPAVRSELDLDALDLRRFAPGATIVRPNHRSTLADPFGDPGSALRTLLNRDVPFADKLRLYRLRRELAGRDPELAFDRNDETIRASLEERGFSEAFIERFAAPFYGGITLDRSLGSSDAIFEYTFQMATTGRTVVPARGMGAIPRQLRDRATDAGAEIRTGKAVTSIDADGESVTVEAENERVFPDAIVVATDPRTADELTDVETPSGSKGCVTVHVSIPDSQSLDTGSRLLLNAADDRPNTVAPLSAAAPEYAPEERQLLSATFLGKRDENDEQLGEAVVDALAAWYPENSFGRAEILAVDRIDFAQFPQPPGFRRTLPSTTDPYGAVYLAGDYTEWSSIQGALRSGRTAAEAVLEDLQ